MSNNEDTAKLREAIRDLRHQVLYLEDCRDENMKTEIERKESCQKLIDIQAKNDNLTIELNSVKTFRDKVRSSLFVPTLKPHFFVTYH
jgi:hypothetical protein